MAEQIKSQKAASTMFFIIAVIAVVLAFSSGASFLGMIFIIIAIASLGYGAGRLMNSPCETSGLNKVN